VISVVALLASLLAPVAALVLGQAVASAASSQDWPTYLHDPSRSNATTDANLSVATAGQLQLNWSYQTGGPLATSASIVGTTAYVGSWDGYEYAINVTNGSLVWKTYTGATNDANCNPANLGITSAAAVVNGVVYVGGGGPYWYALDAATGTVLWQVYTGDNSASGAHYNWSSPLIVNGFAYVGIASNCDNPLVQGQLLKIDLNSHQIVATHNFVPSGQVGGGVWTSPTYDPATNKIFVSTGTLADYTQTESQAIVALDAGTLNSLDRWQLPFGASISDSDWGTTPTLTTDANGNQLLSVANKNGILYTFNRNNLAAGPVWQRQIAIGGTCPTCGDGSIASGIFANGTLYYAGGHAVVNGHGSGGAIAALDPGTGNVLWTRQTDKPILGSPAYVNGMIALAEGSTFEVVNAANGALLYSYLLPSGAYGALSVAQSQFYAGTLDGKLNAFGIGPAPSPPPADPNCPAGFTCQDIHNPSSKGNESTTKGILTVNAAGTGVRGTGDQFRLISEAVTGDAQDSVQIASQNAPPATSYPAESGLIVRQTAAVASPFYAILYYPNDSPPDLQVTYRSAWAKNSVKLASIPATLPVSVMIQRTGNLFSAGVSTDSANYQLIPGTTTDVDLPTTTLQGLAVASGSSSAPTMASFASLSIGGPVGTTMTPPAPADPCPAAWTCADPGNPGPSGDTTSTGNSFTLSGTGSGLGGATDSAHYVYQSVSGSQSISAQVVTQSGASGAAQDGLMMRANVSPTAPMYSVYLNPGGTATIQWRVYDGIAYKNNIPLPSSTSPAWLEIVSWQDTRFSPPQTNFSTMTSTDGVNWSPVLGSDVVLNFGTGSYLAGLVATSGTKSTTPAVFNAVALSGLSSAPPGVCPTGWSCTDVGAPGTPPGNQLYQNGTWTIQASGDLWSIYDEFRFAYQSFPANPAASPNGDGTITAHVDSQTGGGPWMRSGVLIRAGNGTDPEAPYYGVFQTPSNGVAVQWRPTEGAQTNQITQPGLVAPQWVMAARYTDTVHNTVYYTAYTSPDGVNWTYVPGSQIALNLPGPLVAGVGADANSSTNLTTSVFDSVAQQPVEYSPPLVCPTTQGWSCTDIGGALPAGTDQLTSNGTWNETGGGGDIWGTADAFHYVSQTLSADGTVMAHVSSQQTTSAWAKAGPMLRATSDPGSPYYGVFVTPGNGIVVQWRATQGGSSSQVASTGTVPVYLMVARYTAGASTYYTAYISPDGSTWTAVPGSTTVLSMPGTLLAGFGITSHNQGTPSAVTLDTVSINAVEYPPPALSCPTGWSCPDIGSPTPQGQQTLTNGAWSILGGGNDIYGTADSFHYVDQTLSADGTLAAHVTSQQNTSAWAKAGPMLRMTTDPGSPYYAVLVTPGNGIVVQWRAGQGGSTSQVATTGTVPVYLMVGRYTAGGKTYYTAYTSPDGSTWTAIPGSTVGLNMTGTLLAGLAVTSHNSAVASDVGFDTVSINAVEYPPPGLSCPTGWSCADVGSPTPMGQQTLTNGTWSIVGGGSDIYGAADSFHFVSQPLAANGSISARVASQTNSSSWAKGGLMMRLTTDPGSPYYAVFVTPLNGIVVQWRTAQGGGTSQVATTGAAPVYLMISRTATTLSAQISSDGVNWTTVANSTVTIANLSGSLLRGLAVTSHNSNQSSTVVSDTVVTTP
jgi:hypothetical protein